MVSRLGNIVYGLLLQVNIIIGVTDTVVSAKDSGYTMESKQYYVLLHCSTLYNVNNAKVCVCLAFILVVVML